MKDPRQLTDPRGVGRRVWWTHTQALAWIVYGTESAVHDARGQCAGAIIIDHVLTRAAPGKIGKEVAEAEKKLLAELAAGTVATKGEKYRKEDVQRIPPIQRERGRGRPVAALSHREVRPIAVEVANARHTGRSPPAVQCTDKLRKQRRVLSAALESASTNLRGLLVASQDDEQLLHLRGLLSPGAGGPAEAWRQRDRAAGVVNEAARLQLQAVIEGNFDGDAARVEAFGHVLKRVCTAPEEAEYRANIESWRKGSGRPHKAR